MSFRRNGWQNLLCTAILILFTNCTKKENLPDKLASIRENLSSEPATSVKKLQELNSQYQGNPDILITLADAYLMLPGNNHLIAAVHLEQAGRLNNGEKQTWLRAARLFAEAGDVSAQLENLCLHLQDYPDEEAWLDLGQILIQSNRQKDLEVAQQILFGEDHDRPNPEQLRALLKDLQQNSLITELSKAASTASGLQAVQTIRLLQPEDTPKEEQLVAYIPPKPPLPITETAANSRTEDTLTDLPHLPLPPILPLTPGLIGKSGANSATGSSIENSTGLAITAIENVEIIETPPTTQPASPPQEAEPSEAENVLTEHAPPTPPEPTPATIEENTDPEQPNTTTEPEPPEPIETTPPEPATPPEDPFELAQKAFEEKDYATASTHYWKAVRQDPDNPETWYHLSRSFFRDNALKKAEMMALEAARRDPKNPEYVVHFLKVVREQQDPETLHTELKRARKMFPDDPFVIYELAVSYANTDSDTRAAIILFNEFLEKHPDHPHAPSATEALEQLEK